VLQICIQIEGEDMSQVEVVTTGTIGGGSGGGNPLAISQTTFTFNGNVGDVIPVTPVAQVTGGVAPIVFTLDQDTDGSKGLIQKSAADLAALGLALDEANGNITISGTLIAAGPVSFGVVATDATGAKVAARTARRFV
jgi:hypothetical protein